MKLKDKKIEIGENIAGVNQNGFKLPPVFTPIAPPLWAYYRQLSGKEISLNLATFTENTVLFQINWRNDITTKHIVRFRGEEYNVRRIDDFEGYKKDLLIYADKKV